MKHLADIVAAAETVKRVRRHEAKDERRRECVAAMLECIRLGYSWRDLNQSRAAVAADLAAAWARDAMGE